MLYLELNLFRVFGVEGGAASLKTVVGVCRAFEDKSFAYAFWLGGLDGFGQGAGVDIAGEFSEVLEILNAHFDFLFM